MKFEGTVPTITESQQKTLRFDNGHWQFPEQMGDVVGFIYIVRDNYLKRFYLGKKLFTSAVKGTKQRKASSWKKYTTSSKLLAELFEERPKEEFDFICLEQYRTKGTLSYAETWTLCQVEAPTSLIWYNKRIEAVSWKVSETISERHKQRLADTLLFKDMRC